LPQVESEVEPFMDFLVQMGEEVRKKEEGGEEDGRRKRTSQDRS